MAFFDPLKFCRKSNFEFKTEMVQIKYQDNDISYKPRLTFNLALLDVLLKYTVHFDINLQFCYEK